MSAHSVAKVAIVGTAGRKPYTDRMTLKIFEAMVREARRILETDLKLPPENTCLVSGGAAWADHVAVRLFVEQRAAELKLFLPAPWNGNSGYAESASGGNWRSNPGRVSNYYHKTFSRVCRFDSLREIETARVRGAVLDSTRQGFHQRNSDVAREADVLIAFTWGEEPDRPADGGTLDTWNKCPARVIRIHVPLSRLVQ